MIRTFQFMFNGTPVKLPQYCIFVWQQNFVLVSAQYLNDAGYGCWIVAVPKDCLHNSEIVLYPWVCSRRVLSRIFGIMLCSNLMLMNLVIFSLFSCVLL